MSQRSTGRIALEWLPLTLVTATPFAVFAFTLCPTVFAGDSGELALAAHVFGVPHPPGYPLFTTLARVFSAIGGAEPAYSTNLLCAVIASAAVGVLFLLLRLVTRSGIVAAGGALTFAFTSILWGQATVTEVYSLVALFTFTLLLVLARVERRSHGAQVYLLAYLAGLGLVIHQSLVLFLPAVLWVVWARRSQVSIGGVVGLVALGVSPYAILWLRAQAGPAINWGAVESVRDLLGLLLRRNYGAIGQNPLGWDIVIGNVQGFFAMLVSGFRLPVLVLAPLGLFALSRRLPRFGRLTAVMFLSFLVGIIVLVRPYPDRVRLFQLSSIYMPLFCIVALWVGAGMHHLALLFVRGGQRMERLLSTLEVRSAPWIGKAVWSDKDRLAPRTAYRSLAILALSIPLWLLFGNFSEMNRRDFVAARVYGENLLRSVPRGATLIVDGDNEAFILAYLTLGVGHRPDVTVFHRKGHLFDAPRELKRSPRGELETRARRWEHDILAEHSPVFYATYRDLSYLPDWKLVREGIVYRAIRPRDGAAEAEALARDGALLASYDTSVLDRPAQSLDFLVRKFVIGYVQAQWEHARTTGNGAREAALLDAIGELGYDFAEAHYFVGLDRERHGDLAGAYDAFLRAAKLAPTAPDPWQALLRVRSQMAPSPASR